jgi:hypothetical protein
VGILVVGRRFCRLLFEEVAGQLRRRCLLFRPEPIQRVGGLGPRWLGGCGRLGGVGLQPIRRRLGRCRLRRRSLFPGLNAAGCREALEPFQPFGGFLGENPFFDERLLLADDLGFGDPDALAGGLLSGQTLQPLHDIIFARDFRCSHGLGLDRRGDGFGLRDRCLGRAWFLEPTQGPAELFFARHLGRRRRLLLWRDDAAQPIGELGFGEGCAFFGRRLLGHLRGWDLLTDPRLPLFLRLTYSSSGRRRRFLHPDGRLLFGLGPRLARVLDRLQPARSLANLLLRHLRALGARLTQSSHPVRFGRGRQAARLRDL